MTGLIYCLRNPELEMTEEFIGHCGDCYNHSCPVSGQGDCEICKGHFCEHHLTNPCNCDIIDRHIPAAGTKSRYADFEDYIHTVW